MSARAAKTSTEEATKPVGVAVVCEHRLFCEALGLVISQQSDLEFVGSATTPGEAVELLVSRAPDVVVVDVDFPTPGEAGFDGIDAIRRLKDQQAAVRVLILTGRMDIESMARAAGEGACGFLAKTSSLQDICQAIRTAKDGGMFVEQELLGALVERVRRSSRQPIGGGSARVSVTMREQEVLTLLGEGLDVSQIAKRLGITVNTSRGHVKRILAKLGTHSQLEAVVEAVHQGLLPHLSRDSFP